MEVLSEVTALLSNFEILDAFRRDKEKRGAHHVKHSGQRRASLIASPEDQDKRTLEYEVMLYLEKTVCKFQKEQQIAQFLSESKDWKLTKAEKLMIINHRPSNPVELYVLVEDPATRFGPDDDVMMEKLGEMVETVKRIFVID